VSAASSTAVRSAIFALGLLVACGGNDGAAPDSGAILPDAAVLEVGGGSDAGAPRVPDIQCPDDPDPGPAGSFNHLTSEAISALGDPVHRGFDLAAGEGIDPQIIAGAISYTVADKALEDEDVDVFACTPTGWQSLGTATTDDEGGFSISLAGAARLPLGLRDMFVSVVGDRTSARFLAYVAPDGSRVLVSDVDGTLTSSEDAFFETIALGIEPDMQPNASAAYSIAASRGVVPVFVTARGQQYTQDTRDWLAANQFPRGPLRLSPSFVTLPGGDTVAFKEAAFAGITGANLAIAVGVGNRASDVTAYQAAGVPAADTFVKLPEYQSELQDDLDSGMAIGFTDYADLEATFGAL
jgi:hypothetical protein